MHVLSVKLERFVYAEKNIFNCLWNFYSNLDLYGNYYFFRGNYDVSHNSQNTCRLCNWFTSTLHSCISFINSLLVKLYNLRITFVQLKNLSRSVSLYPRDALIYKIHLILKTLTIKHDTSRQFFSTSHARGRYALPISTPVDFVSVCTLSFVGILFFVVVVSVCGDMCRITTDVQNECRHWRLWYFCVFVF